METIKIAFAPLEERHLPLLLTWLKAPHVRAWWGSDISWTIELVREKYGCNIKGYRIIDGQKKPIHAFLITIGGTEIGYVQWYKARDFEWQAGVSLDGLPQSLGAFDIYIGDPEYVGKGYGSEIMRQFLHDYIDPHYQACIVDPDTANVQAIRAYEKTGFEKIKIVQEGNVTLMLRKRPHEH